MKQFSIRDLLFVFVIVALIVGWLVDRRNRAPVPARFQMQVETNAAFVLDTATGQVWEKPQSSSVENCLLLAKQCGRQHS